MAEPPAANPNQGIGHPGQLGLRYSLPAERRPDPGQVVVAVAHGMILKHELAGKRSVAIERHWRGAIQFLIAQRANCRGRGRTVGCQ